jgi:hypothetical protein
VPYHMMYFDRDLVAHALERGKDVPEAEQRTQRTIGELNQWNADQFAKRPTDETPKQSIARWQAVRERIRAVTSGMGDERLGDLVWIPLTGCGWVPAAASLGACIAHTWSEFVQLRFHMGASEPEPPEMGTHIASGFLQEFLPGFVNREKAQNTNFTLVNELTGPGGGAWTLRVANGEVGVTEERGAQPDLVITQDPVTAELVRQGKLDFMAEVQAGHIQVHGMENMQTFGELFPEPSPETQFPPMGPGARD